MQQLYIFPVGNLNVELKEVGRVGSGRVRLFVGNHGSGRVGSGRVGSGRVGSGRVNVSPGRVREKWPMDNSGMPDLEM